LKIARFSVLAGNSWKSTKSAERGKGQKERAVNRNLFFNFTTKGGKTSPGSPGRRAKVAEK
jgi:hypothetical protein